MGPKSAIDPDARDDLSLKHLRVELARIDLLIRRAVRRWQLAGQDPADAFRGLHVADAEADMLLRRPFGANWGQMARPSSQESQAFAGGLAELAREAQSLVEEARRQGRVLCLDHLATAFDLDRFDLDTLLICLAPTLDLRYERLYGYLQDDVTRKRPRVNLVLDLLCQPDSGRLLMLSRFAQGAPLCRHHLLELVAGSGPEQTPVLGEILNIDPTIVAWLLGRYQPHAELGTQAVLESAEEPQNGVLLSPELKDKLRSALDAEQPILAFHGPDQASQREATAWLATETGRLFLAVDLAAVIQAGVSPARALRLALRDARLVGAIPFLRNWEACFASEKGVSPPPDLLSELFAFPGLAIVSGQAPWQPRGVPRSRHLYWLEFSRPSYPQRCSLWSHFLEGASGVDPAEVSALASQFLLTAGQIRDAVASARDAAAQRGEPVSGQDLFAAARAHSNPHLSGLARKIEPRFEWRDIVLPGDQMALLREIVATVRGRPKVLEEWGVGRKLVSSVSYVQPAAKSFSKSKSELFRWQTL